MAKRKFDLNKVEHETNSRYKKTSIGRRPSSSMMNKAKKKSFKKYVGQGK